MDPVKPVAVEFSNPMTGLQNEEVDAKGAAEGTKEQVVDTTTDAEVSKGPVAEGKVDVDDLKVDIPVEATNSETELLLGWRRENKTPSLGAVNSSVKVPGPGASWWNKSAAFLGVGFMVSVGYMDPGNWATDLAGGAQFGYMLLIVILLSNFAAMFLQALSLKLGVAAERDLAQACRDAYPMWAVYILWFLAEVAIAATDLAEVIGSATALNLLFGIPLWAGVLITVVDVLFILWFGSKNHRWLELIVFLLVATIFGCFIYELAVVSPDWALVGKGFIPDPEIITNTEMLYIAIGILGATVMPHNIYLHSSIIQTRNFPRTVKGKKMAIKYGTIDSTVSLLFAFFVNAAILIVAAAVFHYGAYAMVDEPPNISEAYQLLAPAVGQNAARIIFGIALLASGQSSTITCTLAGQVVMEGFLQIKLKPWIRRLITRLVAIIPAAIVAGVSGGAGAGRLLVMSQVILSLQLSFAIAPLAHFTNSRAKMGQFVNGIIGKVASTILVVIIASLNMFLIVQSIRTNSFGEASGV